MSVFDNVTARKRQRIQNFTPEEGVVISREVLARYHIINGEYSGVVTKEAKVAAWRAVTDAVNAVAPVERPVDSVSTRITSQITYSSPAESI